MNTPMNEDIQSALGVLRDGGVILYPTDTVWGIGCDATNPAAVAKIYRLKQRSDSKSMIILVDIPGRIPSYVASVPDIAWDLIELSNKPLTIIYPKAKNLAKNLVAEDGSIGIRVVMHEFCQKLIQKLGKPIVSTSANISGQPSPKKIGEISDEIKNGVDFIVPEIYDKPLYDKPSSIIAIGEGNLIKVIRE